MAYIYAYAENETDCSTIGLVGALMDEDAEFNLKAGEFGELTFKHPVDPFGKWRALQNGAILKTMVPMRVPPAIVHGTTDYKASVDVYTVSRTAVKPNRYVYSKNGATKKGKKDEGKKKKLLKVGATVTVTGSYIENNTLIRYKVTAGSGKKKVSGWMEPDGLTLEQRDVPIPQSAAGIESAAPSYAVRQQLFRIYSVEQQTDDDDQGHIEVSARRIAYDLMGNVTTYVTTTDTACLTACRGILNNTLAPHDFEIDTDIADTHVSFAAKDMNPIEALIDPDEGLVSRWGGEVVSDDYDLYVLRRAGLERGVRIEYQKNLIGVDVSADASDVATALRPKGTTVNGKELYLDGAWYNNAWRYNATKNKAGTITGYSDTLPAGYKFYTHPETDAVNGTIIVRDDFDEDSLPRISVLDVSEAKVGSDKNKDVTTVIARRLMAQAAVDAFEGGCDAPEISMDVDFVMLGDTDEYRQYRHLEPLFVYDTVRVTDRRVGVSADISLTEITWDVRAERVAEAKFGSLQDMTATVSSWQISSVSGGKLAPGSVDSGALEAGAISADHIQTNSINTEHLQAESITAFVLAAVTAHINALTAQTITTDELYASYAHMFELVADKLTAQGIQTDRLAAAMAEITVLAAGTATFDRATVQHLVAEAMSLSYGVGGDVFIDNLRVAYAQMVSAAIGNLCIRASDGEYYQIDVNRDGTVTATPATVTDQEAQEGQTASGRTILDTDIVAENLSTTTLLATYALINQIDAARIDVDQLFAREAFIERLNTTMITSDTVVNILSRLQDADDLAEQLRLWFSFDSDEGLIIQRRDEDGLPASIWSTVTDEVGYHIRRADLMQAVFSAYRDRVRVQNLEIGDIVVKPSSAGGWVWTERR